MTERVPNFGPTGQVCRECEIHKPFKDFAARKDNRTGYKYTCKECESAYQKAYRAANKAKLEDKRKARYSPGQKRAYELAYKYGVTLDWYEQQLIKQNDVCAICKKPASEGSNFAIDHDHSCCPGVKSCGKCVRSLLCNRCNTGLGYFQDNKELLLAAVEYLRSYE